MKKSSHILWIAGLLFVIGCLDKDTEETTTANTDTANSITCTPGDWFEHTSGQCCECPDSGVSADATCSDIGLECFEPQPSTSTPTNFTPSPSSPPSPPPSLPPSPGSMLCTPGESFENASGQCCECPDSGVSEDATCFDIGLECFEPSEPSNPGPRPPANICGTCFPGEIVEYTPEQCCICPDNGVSADAVCYDNDTPQGCVNLGLPPSSSEPRPTPDPTSEVCTPEICTPDESFRDTSGQCCDCPANGVSADAVCYDNILSCNDTVECEGLDCPTP